LNGVALLDIGFGRFAAFLKRRIHQHHLKSLAAQVNEGKIPGRIIGKEAAGQSAPL
jgi:hypothetical protein